MRNYIREFIQDLEDKINNKYKFKEKDIVILKDKIAFFQHERLIHLLVTLFYVIFTLIFLGLSFIHFIFLIPFFMLLIFLIFYIYHYFFLENAVQYIYKLYDQIMVKYK